MKKINDYAWRDLPKFSEKNLNPVDSLIFSQLSYLEFGKFFENDNEKIPLKDFLRIERFEHLLSNAWDHKLNKDLLFGVGMNKRFRDVYVYKCRSITSKENDEQFFAVTFIIDDNLSYIAFRGTDTSVVGWKEDFNMAYMMPVPSQTHALRYLDELGKELNGKIYVGGHSKGGNLAVYSSVFTEKQIKNKIDTIFSHDGPGFSMSLFDKDEYKEIKNKINKTIPTQSFVGILLENQEEYSVVESSQVGIFQHNPFTWGVGENDFIYGENISKTSVFINDNIKKWLESLSCEEREHFVDALFNILDLSGMDNIQNFTNSWTKELPVLIRSIKNTDAQTKKFLYDTIKSLIMIHFEKSAK